jgi:hypothetical protein
MEARAGSVEELRRLVAALERSGLAERRPEVAALLAQSRARLGAPRRPQRHRAEARAHTRALLALVLDALAVLAVVTGTAGLAAGTLPPQQAAAWLAAGMGWGVLRMGAPLARGADEGLRRAAWWARRGLAWVGEPFSDAAFARLEATDGALDIMRAWQRHAAAQGLDASLEAVAAFLSQRHGPLAAQHFRELATAWLEGRGGWTLRGSTATPIPVPRRLRWSGLIRLFEELAAEDSLWAPEPAARRPAPASPPIAATPLPVAAPTQPPEPAEAEESAEQRQRRIDLRDLIRRKRQDINTAHGWKLKTPAEMAQRDVHLNALRQEISALEAELSALGPERPTAAPIRLTARG